MAILLDTHTLVWAIENNAKLSRDALSAITSSEPLRISAVTAWEYADLQQRGRIPGAAPFTEALDALDAQLLDLPAQLWRMAAQLPYIHGDPVDRMMIAHAIAADMTIVTADATIRRYPVRTIW